MEPELVGMDTMSAPILVINSGSSSLKFGIFTNQQGQESLEVNGSIDGIGHAGGKLKVKNGVGKPLQDAAFEGKTLEEAFAATINALGQLGWDHPVALGHRIVHGGPKLRQHQRLTPEVLETLKEAAHFAPLHDPPAIAIIEAAQKHFHDLPQFLCFDTAFHRTIPEVGAHYPLPVTCWEQGVQRYGFHGISYESIVRSLGDHVPQRVIAAHLGNGASLAAILEGKSVDTSMGLTPTGGIPMGTRSGDLDPGVVLWLLRSGKSVDEVEGLLNHQSGLAGLSNGESDMRALTAAAEKGDAPSILAIDIFTRAIARTIGSYIVSLQGLDTLIFTGGIGENSHPVREKVCNQLLPLAIYIDKEKNRENADVISTSDSSAEIRVIPTDEDGQIARHTRAMLLSSATLNVQAPTPAVATR
jgi:acetate kinase